MKQIHATTRSSTTYLLMLMLLVISCIAVYFVPSLSETDLSSFLQTHVYNAGLVYAIIIGFLLYITLTRKQNLEEAVSLELNKSRRIYHLALHMSKAEPRLKKWFLTVEKALENYHKQFRNMTFACYDEGDALFRKVTYSVYSLPQLDIPYNEDLYGSLLDATASATEARETINALKDNTLGRFSWFILLLITTIFCLIIILYTPTDITSRIISFVVVFSLLSTIQLIYEYDRGNRLRHRYIADLYLDNMKKAKHLTAA